MEQFVVVAGWTVLIAPAILFALLGVSSLVARPLPERLIGRLVPLVNVVGLLAAGVVLAWMLSHKDAPFKLELGRWIEIAPERFTFALIFVFDRLSVPFVILSFLLCGTVGAFANRYMHRDRAFHRFFAFYSMFLFGVIVATLSGTIETLFAGWELVGLSSALLVAFFHERPAPVTNGLHVWIVYRVADAALLLAAVLLHHTHSHGEFAAMMTKPWPDGATDLVASQAVPIGALLLVAAAGKSALVPFSGWLPRAMEGPTPSSAVFYGALSVHLGAFLLMRFSPIIQASLILKAAVIVVGLATAAFAAFASRVQSDVKCALSFDSLTQVGIIVVWIGCDLQYLALIHILGHACFRTLQFVRAPTILYDYRVIEDAIGERLQNRATDGAWLRRASDGFRLWLYRLAIERGHLDQAMWDWLVHPILWTLRRCDAIERGWLAFLSGPKDAIERNRITAVTEDLL